MKILYLIPGTGADQRFFSRLELDVPVKVIEWDDWGEANSINEYAKVLSSQIDTDEPFGIVGASFGGMLAVEMATFLPVEKLILISSVKTYKELPAIVRVLNGLGVRFLIFPSMVRKLPFAAQLFGVSKKEKIFFDKMLAETSDIHLKKTIVSILKWKFMEPLSDVVHIHGSKDKVIPIKAVKNAISIKNGGHFMVYNKAKEVSRAINEKLQKK